MSITSKRLSFFALFSIIISLYLGQLLVSDSYLNGFFESTISACESYEEVKASSACAVAERMAGIDGSVNKSKIDLLKYAYWLASLVSIVLIVTVLVRERNIK